MPNTDLHHKMSHIQQIYAFQAIWAFFSWIWHKTLISVHKVTISDWSQELPGKEFFLKRVWNGANPVVELQNEPQWAVHFLCFALFSLEMAENNCYGAKSVYCSDLMETTFFHNSWNGNIYYWKHISTTKCGFLLFCSIISGNWQKTHISVYYKRNYEFSGKDFFSKGCETVQILLKTVWTSKWAKPICSFFLLYRCRRI